jgi:hypothetical protein
MQPCPTCGGMGIDANGYCTQCRNYRGLPQAAPPSSGVPYSGAPYSGAPYGGSPAPYAGYPTSSGPAYPQPTSGGAAFPGTTYGGAYGAPATPPQKGRNSFMTPLLALSGVLAVVVIAIVVVVIVKSSDDPGTTNNPATGTALVDQCVVGTWELTSYREDVSVPQVGPVPFSLDGKGATMKFNKEGKGVQDFGDGTEFTGDVNGATVTLKITGDISFDFRTNDGVMSYSNMVSNSKAIVSAAGSSQTEDFKGSTDPSKYTCSGDKMTMSTSLYQSELKRTSTTP